MSNVSPLPEVLVSLTSFGAAEVRRHGQLWFAQLCAQAGANAVEVREELLVDAAQELPAIAQWLRTTSLWSVYSCPQPLFAMDGSLDEAVLAHAIAATHTLGAKWLKMSIGQFAAQSVADSAQGFAQLQAKVQAAGRAAPRQVGGRAIGAVHRTMAHLAQRLADRCAPRH